jgi:hypothetical protein
MRNKYLGLALLILAGFALTGCETYRQRTLSENWGRSYQAIQTNHVINPDAGMDEKTVEGIDGTASEKALNKYHKSFDEKPPTQVMNINISGVGSK